VAERLGLWFDEGHLDELADILRRRGGGCTAVYLERLSSSPSGAGEWRQIANELTVSETYFFRYAEQFEAFAQVALPERMKAKGVSRQLRILSAGCSSGEEPYSLAILASQAFKITPGWSVQILGVDLNTSLLEKAVRARYSGWALRGAPQLVRERYFRPEGREYALDESIRPMVKFEQRNLIEDATEFWRAGSFDIIFFRNVSIYFAPETTKGVIARIAQALAPGGFLFLGPSETLRGISRQFHLRHTQGTFYYQRLAPEETEAQLDLQGVQPSPMPVAGSPMPGAFEKAWVDEIGRAADRINQLASGSRRSELSEAESSALPASERDITASAAASPNLEKVRDLLQRELFAEALAALGTLAPESPPLCSDEGEAARGGTPAQARNDPDALLLRAVLLTNAGRIAEAESVCHRVLKMSELDAGAHYVAALCREHAGDRLGAAEHDETAVYLDPAFAMPRLHLGMMAKRAGDLAIARRELSQALNLLGQENSSRLLLFGGGFSRETLLQLCRAELRTCGEGS
jgi:chemotaxis protein methyltransferase CheR